MTAIEIVDHMFFISTMGLLFILSLRIGWLIADIIRMWGEGR